MLGASQSRMRLWVPRSRWPFKSRIFRSVCRHLIRPLVGRTGDSLSLLRPRSHMAILECDGMTWVTFDKGSGSRPRWTSSGRRTKGPRSPFLPCPGAAALLIRRAEAPQPYPWPYRQRSTLPASRRTVGAMLRDSANGLPWDRTRARQVKLRGLPCHTEFLGRYLAPPTWLRSISTAGAGPHPGTGRPRCSHPPCRRNTQRGRSAAGSTCRVGLP
ncbi:uncharacterized protein B0H64DRAFT_36285 [Chaetomium fimeti]|uniref:Uncharacterized protein n=1 Tax=Chaetomium fimeti TaxID=1854472 RepID=A0AAE0HRF1_9PEZI|nr:hypothetical protein B0H64DRAFT_36285 [Chaetomium fimeti]